MSSSLRRSILVTGLVIAVAALMAAPALAQSAATADAPRVVASGLGVATGPAESADVQVIIGRGYYGGYAMVESDAIEADATPEAGAEPGMMVDPYTGMMMAGPALLTQEELAPITAAIAASGLAIGEVRVFAPASGSSYTGPSGAESAQIRFTVTNPEVVALDGLMRDLWTAATGVGLSMDHFGVTYGGADCAALQQQARDAAVADARENAERLASALGGEVGALIEASDSPYFGPEIGFCGAEFPYATGPFGGGTAAAFDPTAPAEVKVYGQVMLTFELVLAGEGTPTA